MSSIMYNHTSSQASSSRDSKSRRGSDSDASYQSSAPTSVTESPRLYCREQRMPQLPPPQQQWQQQQQQQQQQHQQQSQPQTQQPYRPRRQYYEPLYEPQNDVSPVTRCYSRGSKDSFVSSVDEDERREVVEVNEDLYDDDYEDEKEEEEEEEREEEEEEEDDNNNNDDDDDDWNPIPPLPEYQHEIVDSTVRPSTPQDFARLFPSLNRMSIRHDEFTSDGNMNLRVDIAAPASTRPGSGGRRDYSSSSPHRHRHPTVSYQLFHLRMYDLAKREFSLRRYSRDSGREVCNMKLQRPGDEKKSFGEDEDTRPAAPLQRSMSSALRSLGMGGNNNRSKTAFRRVQTVGSLRQGNEKRPRTASTTTSGSMASLSRRSLFDHRHHHHPKTPNTIKLEFSNYARVDIKRKTDHTLHDTNTRYEFAWWGHRYQWKRVAEPHLQVVHFHLLRDGNPQAVAHVVPEMRSPVQVRSDDDAGGWVPPCHMWFSDAAVLGGLTDVADVFMATGLVALVDDCIRTRWPDKPKRKGSDTNSNTELSMVSSNSSTGSNSFLSMPRLRMQNPFVRRNAGQNKTSPLRRPVAAY